MPPRKPSDTRDPPARNVALVLQGGGALGSYQAGVYKVLARNGRAGETPVAEPWLSAKPADVGVRTFDVIHDRLAVDRKSSQDTMGHANTVPGRRAAGA